MIRGIDGMSDLTLRLITGTDTEIMEYKKAKQGHRRVENCEVASGSRSSRF